MTHVAAPLHLIGNWIFFGFSEISRFRMSPGQLQKLTTLSWHPIADLQRDGPLVGPKTAVGLKL